MARRSKLDLGAEIAAIANLSRDELLAAWHKAYGTAPPAGCRQELLIRSAAWHLQAQRLGGYSAETRRLLRSAVLEIRRKCSASAADAGAVDVGDAECAPVRRARRKLHPGARLIRDWNGRAHVVDVVDKGFVYEAKVYPSLSAIAERITGAHWSGPRFFGVTK